MYKVKRLLFQVARSRYAAYFIGNAFAYLTPLMPLDKLYVNDDVIVFKHPVPFWQTHWLAVPKQRLPTFMDLPLTENSFAIAIFQVVQTVTKKMGLNTYRLLVNGGTYQDVPQLHFHIAADASINIDLVNNQTFEFPRNQADVAILRSARAYPHANAQHTNHFVIESSMAQRPLPTLDLSQKEAQNALLDILNLAQQMITNHELEKYTLSTNVTAASPNKNLMFQLIA